MLSRSTRKSWLYGPGRSSDLASIEYWGMDADPCRLGIGRAGEAIAVSPRWSAPVGFF